MHNLKIKPVLANQRLVSERLFFFGRRSFIRNKTQTAVINMAIKRMLENKVHLLVVGTVRISTLEKLNEDCMTEKRNIFKRSRAAVMLLLLLTTSRQLVTT